MPELLLHGASGVLQHLPAQLSGQTPDGKPFSRVIWRHTRCLKCGSSRIDKFYEFDGQERLWQSPQG